jgi:hypothetical protein
MKSMEIISHGLVGIGEGWYKNFFLILFLLVQKRMHPLIN